MDYVEIKMEHLSMAILVSIWNQFLNVLKNLFPCTSSHLITRNIRGQYIKNCDEAEIRSRAGSFVKKLTVLSVAYKFSIAFIAPAEQYRDGDQDLFIPQHGPGNRFYKVSFPPEIRFFIPWSCFGLDMMKELILTKILEKISKKKIL